MTLNDKINEALDLIASATVAAESPVICSSFGKDSLVLLDLCLAIRRMPVLFFYEDPQRFPKKYAFAWKIIEDNQLECFSLPPKAVTHLQDGEYFDIFTSYGGKTTGPLTIPLGSRAWTPEDPEFVCAVDTLMKRVTDDIAYPWDLTFLGHKEADPVPYAKQAHFVGPLVESGTTRLCLPLWRWTDEDITDYTRQHELPIDLSRSAEDGESNNPDIFPVCYQCLDTRLSGQKVYCPILQDRIENKSRSAQWHANQKLALLTSVPFARYDVAEVAPVDPRLTIRFLDVREEWPLFGLRKKIFEEKVYVIIEDLVDISKKPDGLKRLREEWIRLERRCADAGIYGWVASVTKDNLPMQRVLRTTGATPYAEDEERFWVKKRVDANQLVFPSLREMASVVIHEKHQAKKAVHV